ncbi:hypothetical protein SLA2020_361860 [Shorea laevis]
MSDPVAASPIPQLSPNLKVLLVNNNNVISMEEALELLLSREEKIHPLWKERDLFKAWRSPLLTLKSIDPRPFLTSVPALKEESIALVDQCSTQKLEFTTAGASIEEIKGPIQPLKFLAQAWREHLQIFDIMGKMETIHVIIKSSILLGTEEMDYECLMLLCHFPEAMMMLLHKETQEPMFDQTPAKLALGLSNSCCWSMKMLSWNCRGAAKMEFNRRMRDLKNQHSPSIMLILETKLSGQDAEEAAAEYGYPCSHVVDSDGWAGGFWLLWDNNEVYVDVVTSTFQAIHAIVQVHSHPIFSKFHWFLSGVYGRPQFELRSHLWDELCEVAKYFNGPWLVIGDFNDVVDQVEKFGGAPISQSRVRAYTDCMGDYNLMDIGYTGGRFTWVNMRENNHIIRERLDRAWANPDWRLQFPDANLLHLPRISSDHNPLLLYLDTPLLRSGNKPFRLEKFWLNHFEFHDLISPIWSTQNSCTSQCILKTQTSCRIWSRTTFDNIFVKKWNLNARLEAFIALFHRILLNFLLLWRRSLPLNMKKS